eukprot:s1269_g15.t1
MSTSGKPCDSQAIFLSNYVTTARSYVTTTVAARERSSAGYLADWSPDPSEDRLRGWGAERTEDIWVAPSESPKDGACRKVALLQKARKAPRKSFGGRRKATSHMSRTVHLARRAISSSQLKRGLQLRKVIMNPLRRKNLNGLNGFTRFKRLTTLGRKIKRKGLAR